MIHTTWCQKWLMEWTRSYPQYIEKIEGTEAVVRADKASMKDRVGIISGGGSGHEPTHAWFCR